MSMLSKIFRFLRTVKPVLSESCINRTLEKGPKDINLCLSNLNKPTTKDGLNKVLYLI
jgi:hypothetical protein